MNLDDEKDIIENGDLVVNIVSKVRQFKSENKLSLKTEIEEITISNPSLNFIKECEEDIKAVTSTHNIKYNENEFNVEIGNVIPDEK